MNTERQLFAEPRIRLRSRRDPQHAGRRQRPAMPPLPGRNVGRQRSQELRPLPARLLPRPGALRILQALPGRNFHPIGRIQNGRRVRSGLRIRNLFAHRIGPCALCPATSARRWSAKNDSSGGLCLSETHAAFCYCPAGFTGSFCEVNIDVRRLPLPVRPGLHEQKSASTASTTAGVSRASTAKPAATRWRVSSTSAGQDLPAPSGRTKSTKARPSRPALTAAPAPNWSTISNALAQQVMT